MTVPELSAAAGQPAPAQRGWTLRAVERSPNVARSKAQSLAQAEKVLAAASRLIDGGQPSFTTQELVREARMSLQTFYKLFAGKDEVLLAVFEELIGEFCARFSRQALSIEDPLDRLQACVVGAVVELEGSGREPWTQFFTTEHWRLQQLYPRELASATRQFADLLLPDIVAGIDKGRLRAQNPERAAWLIMQLVIAVGHSLAFQPDRTNHPVGGGDMAEHVWEFALAALGATLGGR